MPWPPGFCLAIPAVTTGPAVHSPGPLAPSSLLIPSWVLSVFHWLSPCFPASLYLAISGWLAISVSHLPGCLSPSLCLPLNVYPPLSVCIFLFVYLYNHLHFSFSLCLSVCLSGSVRVDTRTTCMCFLSFLSPCLSLPSLCLSASA